MERENVLEELKLRISNTDVIRHSLAVEAIMRAFARYFKDDEDKWAITGLLHNIDYEKTKDNPEKRGLLAADILEELGADEFVVYSIKSYNDNSGLVRRRKLDKILYCVNPMASLIEDCISMIPSKKIEDVTEEFVMKRFEENSFANSADGEQIKSCTEVEIELGEFIKISLDAMKNIALDLGL